MVEQITSGLIRIKACIKLPERVVRTIVDEIASMISLHERGLSHGKFEGALVRDDGDYGMTIKTRFHQSKRMHGILFRAVIVMHNIKRRIGKLIAKIPTEIIKATIIFKPIPMGKPALN